jgi:hypothetical protein
MALGVAQNPLIVPLIFPGPVCHRGLPLGHGPATAKEHSASGSQLNFLPPTLINIGLETGDGAPGGWLEPPPPVLLCAMRLFLCAR